jgi:hypothetical protein
VLSRCVRFTNRFTEQAIDLQFPHPSAPFHGRRPWARHHVRTRQATAKRHGLDTRRVAPSCPTPGRAAPQSSSPLPGLHRAQTAPLPGPDPPRTRLLPELTADGFCPGSASRSRSDTEGALTCSGWREYSYGGFGGGHPPFHPYTFCRQPNFPLCQAVVRHPPLSNH